MTSAKLGTTCGRLIDRPCAAATALNRKPAAHTCLYLVTTAKRPQLCRIERLAVGIDLRDPGGCVRLTVGFIGMADNGIDTTDSEILSDGIAYWRALDPDARIPGLALFDPVSIPDLLANTVVMDVFWEPLDFRYRFIGDRILEHFNDNYVGRRLSEIPHQANPSALFGNMKTVALDGVPLRSQTPYVGSKRETRRNLELILPLADAGDRVSRLFILIDFVEVDGPGA